MKLTVPQTEIADSDGFSLEKDIFLRKEFGERLANLVTRSNEGLVVALDAEWGEGKSTFIQMWKSFVTHQRDPKIKTIYFDAFANDFQKDPFIALAAEIYDSLKDVGEEKKEEFRKQASAAAKSMLRGAVKIAVRTGTGGLLDGSVVDGVEKDISELLAERVDAVLADRLKNSASDKLALKEFRKYLEKFSRENGEGQPIVFVIDELDRCRPDFALELVEQIKHLFSVAGFTFLLVMNRKQLEESIQSKYGILDASKYLQKFIHLWLTLPRKAEPHDDHGVRYAQYAMKMMQDENERIHNGDSIDLMLELVKYYKPSFRDIERMLSYFSLIQNMTTNGYVSEYQMMIPFICYLKVAHPNSVKEIAANQTNAPRLLKEVGLDRIDGASEYYQLYDLTRLITFDLGDKQDKKRMFDNQEVSGRIPNNIMRNICGWLAEIRRPN